VIKTATALKYPKMKLPNLLGFALVAFTAVQALDIPLPDALKLVYGLPECSVSLFL
jgi:hypothetical protein